jgi:phosphatidylserine decarboxylase
VLTIFYYVFDKANINDLQTPILPTSILGDMPITTPISGWIIGYAIRMGQWLDTPASITPESYATFNLKNSPYKMGDYHIPDPNSPVGGFQSFNQLFCRFLREPYPYTDVRPLAGLNDPNIVIFPADSTFDGAWNIDSNNLVNIKGLEWPISSLLAGSEYADRFAGGTWAHAFLNTFDYHRQHAPVAGTVVEASNIEGLCYLQVIAKQDSEGKWRLAPHRGFRKPKKTGDVSEAQPDAPDDAGYEFIQTRGLVIIDTGRADVGLVAVLPMGMAQVSSVKLAVKPGQTVRKGEEISHFEFGGSDIVLVFEKGAGVGQWPPLNKHHLMGEQMAVLTTPS